MFDFDFFHEIIATISKNKLRTALTGFAVAWGIFLLIVLLSSGNGLKNGVMTNFSGRAQNGVTVWPGNTSVGYDGLPAGRKIKFNYKDLHLITNNISEASCITPRVIAPMVLSYENEYGLWNLEGTNPNIATINKLWVAKGNGRFLNELDVKEKRKVIVINEDIKKILFKNTNPLGKFILAGDIMYEVVGIYEQNNQFQSNPPAYIPISIAQVLYCDGLEYHKIDFLANGLTSKEANEEFNHKLREKFGQLHRFSPYDRSALFIRNTSEAALQTKQILELIDIFVAIVGIASLIAGIVGISNIMLITVKERTKEIGIRKAIGAQPFSVILLIISESTFITTVSGYVGLLIGIFTTEIAYSSLNQASQGLSVFKDPSVDLGAVIAATVIMIFCGVIAGLIPALRASKISPIEAMREE